MCNGLMKLQVLTARPFYNIHVTTAFVNPFTSEAVVKAMGPSMFHTFLGISSIPRGQIYLCGPAEVST